jgi:proline iminopeptidase
MTPEFMRSLYPNLDPNKTYLQKLDNIHQIYFEESGNSNGIPVLFLHGGPGQGSSSNHRRYFDPNRYWIINFDQRGCNRSSPGGEIQNNTTQDLLLDIEFIRETLNIKKWMLFGGSWGATLGLLYAQQYPQCILGMILRGTFLARKRDQEWFTRDGVSRIFPDMWENFCSFIPEDEQYDLVSAYYKRLSSTNADIVELAARKYSDWSGTIVTYLLDIEKYITPDDISETINQAKIETYYGANRYFIQENQILNNINKIPDIPITIIHGRRDLTCTLDASWDLHRALPGSELIIINKGGHLAGESVMTDALITATDYMALQLI